MTNDSTWFHPPFPARCHHGHHTCPHDFLYDMLIDAYALHISMFAALAELPELQAHSSLLAEAWPGVTKQKMRSRRVT